jgi:hypothetical protein
MGSLSDRSYSTILINTLMISALEVPSSVRRTGWQLNKTVEDPLSLMFYAGAIEVQPTKSCNTL